MLSLLCTVGRAKPWGKNMSEAFATMSDDAKQVKATEKWYQMLENAFEEAGIHFDFSLISAMHDKLPPVGKSPSLGLMIKHIKDKKRRNWTPYIE